MKYLRHFENIFERMKKGDFVILLYKDDDSPYSASSFEFTIGDIYKVVDFDINDYEYGYQIKICEYTSNKANTTGGRTWVKKEQIRKATDSDLMQIKYNL